MVQDHMIGRGVAVLREDVPETARLLAVLMYRSGADADADALAQLGRLSRRFRSTLHDVTDIAAARADADGPNKGMYLPPGVLASVIYGQPCVLAPD